MPFYDYRCDNGSTFEHRQSILDEPLTICPTTGQDCKRIFVSGSLAFKVQGSLYYGRETSMQRRRK